MLEPVEQTGGDPFNPGPVLGAERTGCIERAVRTLAADANALPALLAILLSPTR